MANPLSLSILLILSLACSSLSALKVQLFKDLNYKGLIYEYITDLPHCHNVEEYGRGETGSVISDTCLMLFENVNCAGSSFKLSRDMAEVRDLRKSISSFQPCSAEFGGDKIRLDMFDSSSNLIVEYLDICGCQDLPNKVSTKLQSLNNYGNCITAYSTETCGGNSTDIPAGQNGLTQNLPQLGYYVRAVSGCGTRRKCIQLHSKIFKFKILNDPLAKMDQFAPSKVELGTKTYFYNNGSATLTQEYEATKTVRETTTTSMSQAFYSMSSTKVDYGAELEIGFKPDFSDCKKDNSTKFCQSQDLIEAVWGEDKERKLGKQFGDTLYENYNENKPPKFESSTTKEEEKVFAVRQRFMVPPCVQYEVSSTVEMVENFGVIYEAYSMVTGEANGERLTAQEVAYQVDEMTFVEFLDEYTAVFKTSETMKASSGVETIISGVGSDLPGCDMNKIA